MAKVLGLDLGSYSVKGVLFETSMRGYQVLGYGEARRGEGDRAATLRESLLALFQQHSFQPDQAVIALPGQSLATHAISLPFVDTKRIEAALPFELESQLPFELSEAVFDYQVISKRDKKSDLLVGVVRKEELRTLLSTLKEVNVDPKIVTHPGVAYHSLFVSAAQLWDGNAESHCTAVVDLGHERTTVAVGRPGVGVEFARTFSGGGKDLTRILAGALRWTPADAEELKEREGAVGTNVSGPEAEHIRAALLTGFQPIVRELRATLKAFSARAHQTVDEVLLCGGTAKLPGIDEQLSSSLGIPARIISLPLQVGEVISPAVQPQAAQSFALALRGQASSSKGVRLNLRRGDLAFKSDYDYARNRFGVLGSMLAALLILLVASGIVRNSVLSRQEKEVDASLCSLTQQVIGSCETNFDRALNLLRGKESPAAVIPKLSAVTLLSELTQRIPADVPVTFDQIVVDLDRVSVRGETETPKQIDSISGALKSFRCFREVKEGKVQKSKDGQHVSFSLDILVECPEQGAIPQG
jgi:general secretion pathway protein L